MSDRPYSEVLQELHRIHRQLSDLRSRLTRCPIRVNAARNRVTSAEEVVSATKEAIKATKMTADRKQLMLRESESKIAVTEGKLNAAKTNDEFQIFKEQIAAAQMANSVMSDEILEALEKIDQLEAKAVEANLGVEKAKSDLAMIEAEVDQQRTQLESEIARVLQQLEGVEKDIPPDIRADYKRVVKVRGEEALSSVVNGYCTQCNVQLRIQTVSDLKLGKPVFCSSCGAFLYFPE
ncbi:zinc ribbon domain-containing protein [Blastopirellula marina]|uniref:Phospholipase n=1 Tax=Blastopirellula marina TaxID=124 RepID=A0A2S8G0D4_9BACT|nr:phospholipase [Blastopirellula marina]PQO37905.1 phospholipase [Blastopirellula marina]PTL44561.1 phospholipase [Blastopirellula marina]